MSIIVFLVLVLSSAWAGIGSYCATEANIDQDMRHALAMTLEEKGERSITPDTMQTYRRHLTIAPLRERSFLSYDMAAADNTIRCYHTCSFGTILSLSDQRLSLLLSVLAMMWAAGSLVWFRRKQATAQELLHVGTLSYAAGKQDFYDQNNRPVRLTPMQHQLMTLFFRADNHRLTKAEICQALWPGKEDASETLYTLIRRLKPVVEANSNLQITSDRGRAYRLTTKETD